jgi:hypothetical protein
MATYSAVMPAQAGIQSSLASAFFQLPAQQSMLVITGSSAFADDDIWLRKQK